ncbi:winged helix-turn-helix domain-containing protein [Streptosporangium roseum]|nr:helix-turn-helix domain-containing protein [Streptosporangium roseum]
MIDAPEPPAGSDRPVRVIDARSLRGLAHPLRMRLLDLLKLDGPATSAGLSERLGEKTGTVSWHLRLLAEHGFIEEETGRGTRRERWWRVVASRTVLNTADFREDPGSRGALSLYLDELVRRNFRRVADSVGEEWDDRWRGARSVSEWTEMRMTPAQLHALNEELTAVVERHAPDPDAEPDPEALPVVVQIQSFPRKGRGGE